MGERYNRMGESNGKRVLPNDSVVDVIDEYAGRVITIPDEKSKINYGKHFIHNEIDRDVDTAKEWIVHSDDDKDYSFELRINTDDSGELEVFEGTEVSSYGSKVTTFNSNRVIGSSSPDLHLYKDPSVSSDGNRLIIYLVGTSSGPPRGTGGIVGTFRTLILNTSEQDYLIRFTPDNDSTRIVFSSSFHEYKKR